MYIKVHLTFRGQFHKHFTCYFYEGRSQKRKKDLTLFFSLLGSALVKAVSKMLLKSILGQQQALVGDPDANITSIGTQHFFTVMLRP